MTRGQDNGTTILLGLKDYKAGEVVEGVESGHPYNIVIRTSAG